MKIPKNLTHKPIIVVEDYDKIDGYFANDTDAKGLSLGQSTWDYNDISVKVWRHPDKRWSRQSEELPIHRVLDLSILALSSSLLIDSKKEKSISNLGEVIEEKEKFDLVKEYFIEHKDDLVQKVEELARVANIFLEKYK